MIDYIVVAGNTTMMHLFYGIDPQHIREEPYIPAATFFPPIRGKSVGLHLTPQAVVYSMPNVASYVGGDISSGVLVSQMHKQDKVSLFIDIGTNGEIVLGNREWLVTAACSAGPAFEGSGIKFGMRAMEGAIEEVEIDPKTYEANYQVIGDVKPIGICGSGMIDILAEMYLTGVIDQKGKIREEIKSKRIRRGENGLEYVIAWRVEGAINKEIVITEVDLDNLIRAKAAIYACCATLLSHMARLIEDLEAASALRMAKRAFADTLEFPFEVVRPGQDEIVSAVARVAGSCAGFGLTPVMSAVHTTFSAGR